MPKLPFYLGSRERSNYRRVCGRASTWRFDRSGFLLSSFLFPREMPHSHGSSLRTRVEATLSRVILSTVAVGTFAVLEDMVEQRPGPALQRPCHLINPMAQHRNCRQTSAFHKVALSMVAEGPFCGYSLWVASGRFPPRMYSPYKVYTHRSGAHQRWDDVFFHYPRLDAMT